MLLSNGKLVENQGTPKDCTYTFTCAHKDLNLIEENKEQTVNHKTYKKKKKQKNKTKYGVRN